MADAGPDPVLFARLAELVTRHRTQREGLFVLGLCGAQGSGKSTLAAALARMLARDGTRTAILSLDDIYLTRAERLQLAREVHPLFATRGAPGTHDVALGLATI
jgi:D-glycerate 3-kinase